MKKLVIELSNQIMSEKIKEWLSFDEIVLYLRSLEPKNKIEKRIIQRSICILNWYKMHNEWIIENKSIIHLIDYIK